MHEYSVAVSLFYSLKHYKSVLKMLCAPKTAEKIKLIPDTTGELMAKPEKKLKELKTRLLEVGDLNHINALLGWDQSTYMPAGRAEARGRQSALLAQMAQEKFIDRKIGKLLDDLRPYEASLPYDSDDASLIRVTRRNYQRDLQRPPKVIGELNEHGTKSYQE